MWNPLDENLLAIKPSKKNYPTGWTTVQIVLGLIGLSLALAGSRLSLPLLTLTGMICLGLAALAIGWEAILTRRIVLGSRPQGTRETYTGLAAILHGIQFNLIGLFLIGVSVVVYENTGREIVLQFVRRPGPPPLDNSL